MSAAGGFVRYKGASGRSYELAARPFNGGAEAEVLDVRGCPGLVAKVYFKPLDARRRKVEAMVRSVPDKDMQAHLAWPLDALYRPDGAFAGFVMRRCAANGIELGMLYEPADARAHGFDFGKQLGVAGMLSDITACLHARGVCIGDFNPRNVLVFLEARGLDLAVIDNDSFAFADAGGCSYPCLGWTPEFSAPEVHAAAAGGVRDFGHSIEGDRFALAVHVFKLLMAGCHPFDTRLVDRSAKRPSTEEAIRQGVFVYERPVRGLAAPLHAPEYGYLPKDVRRLFARAFLGKPHERPTAREWCQALERMAADGLSSCPRGHRYPSSAATCPWCDLEARRAKAMGRYVAATATKASRAGARGGAGSRGSTRAAGTSSGPARATGMPSSGGRAAARPGTRRRLIAWCLGILLVLGTLNSCVSGMSLDLHSLSQDGADVGAQQGAIAGQPSPDQADQATADAGHARTVIETIITPSG